MDRKAILVLGPEASGTRLVTRILVSAGCFGDDSHDQRLDWRPPVGLLRGDHLLPPDPIVWRRSLPHDNLWPDVQGMMRELHQQSYHVTVVATDRDDGPMAAAQARDHVRNERVARQHIERARDMIAQIDRAGIPLVRVRYEQLIAEPQTTVVRLCERLGLHAINISTLDIYDGNAKYQETATV